MREAPRRPGPPANERNAIRDWLLKFLAAGPRPAAEVREAALGHGYTNATLRRTFRELGGVAARDLDAQWNWSLPDGTAQITDPAELEQYRT